MGPKIIYKKFSFLILLFVLISSQVFSEDRKTITFKAEDRLEITADVYIEHELTKPFIILFHQAGWSRGEYLKIAPKLNGMGFNCMAVDQRSGNMVNEIENETYKRAVKENKTTDYLSAYTDMKAAMKFAKENYAKGKLIVWGSSYSASLVIKLAGDHSDLIDAVVAFSPGEYFAELGEGENFITTAAKKVQCPVFIASASNEKEDWEKIYNAIPGNAKSFFIPTVEGNHGSKALWMDYFDSGSYWLATKKFLMRFLGEFKKGKNNADSNK